MTTVHWITIALAAVITYSIRASFLVVARRMTQLPHAVRTVLRMIPAAALSAITIPALVRPDGVAFDPVNSMTLGGVVAVVVSLWRRNIGLSLGAGLVVVVLTRPLFG